MPEATLKHDLQERMEKVTVYDEKITVEFKSGLLWRWMDKRIEVFGVIRSLLDKVGCEFFIAFIIDLLCTFFRVMHGVTIRLNHNFKYMRR